MKPILILAAWLLTLCAVASHAAPSDGAPLINAKSYVVDAASAPLDAAESKRLSKMRARRFARASSLVKLDTAAFNSNLLTISLPSGKVLAFIREPSPIVPEKVNDPDQFWYGHSADRTALLSIGINGAWGSIDDGSEHYIIETAGRFNVLTEINPTGWRQIESPEAYSKVPRGKAP